MTVLGTYFGEEDEAEVKYFRGKGVVHFSSSVRRSIGFLAAGSGIVVDDNDIRDVAAGINYYSDAGSAAVQSFDIYSNNSFAQVSAGIAINANWDPANVADQPYFIGNVYRQNIFSGVPGQPDVAAIQIVSNAGSNTSNVNTMQLLMNVFDSNTVSQVHYVFAFATTTNSDVTGDGIGGLMDTVLWNNFAFSDGDSDSYAVFRTINPNDPMTDLDPSPFFLEVNNVWQLFESGETGIVTNPA